MADTVAIGRADDNTIRLDDSSVSRHHARIVLRGDGAYIEDAGSSHGTFVDGRKVARPARLRDGARIQIGNKELRTERRRDEAEAGRTLIVRAGASLLVPAVGPSQVEGAPRVGFRPRVHSGWALKRLEAGEGAQRYILKDLRGGDFVRMGEDEAEMFKLLDGSRTLHELISEAEQRFGTGGSGRLARLLADLGEKGFLEGVEKEAGEQEAPKSRLAKLLTPREFAIGGLGKFFERVYLKGGFVLFTRPGLITLAAIAGLGLCAFAFLIFGRYGTPFVVAEKIGLGGLVFLFGRFFVVALHELAHGLTVASYGRRVQRAGLKLMLIFPFAFVDTSDAWFEPRKRRFAISAAGPANDLVIGGAFALGALVSNGTWRDIFFQLGFAAYMGAFSNLNPLLDRDGYHMLVDLTGEPGLRRRAREHVAKKLSGKTSDEPQPKILSIYGSAALGWSLIAVAFVIILTTRYYGKLILLAPKEVVWSLFVSVYLLMFVPIFFMIGRPLLERRKDKGKIEDAAPA